MKILVCGNWHSELHEESVFHAFKELGHDSFKFAWHQYFKPRGIAKRLTRFFFKAQNKYMMGPLVTKLNKDFINFALEVKPDLIFIYRGTHIYARTVKILSNKLKNTLVIGYNNDDPFSPHYPKWFWRHFLSCVPEYDLTLAYRQHNIDEYRVAGARRVQLLRSWFIPERNYPTELTDLEKEKYSCDVVFIGHYENDGRLEFLEEIERRGWSLRIFGHGNEWNPVLRRVPLLAGHMPIQPVWGQDYNLALCGAKIALCFFSKLNRDTYTRRCFEITASGTVLLSKYTDDVASLFIANQEVVLFRDAKEMCAVIESLLADATRRSQLAKAGTQRVWRDGHDVVSRMQCVLGWVDKIMEEKN